MNRTERRRKIVELNQVDQLLDSGGSMVSNNLELMSESTSPDQLVVEKIDKNEFLSYSKIVHVAGGELAAKLGDDLSEIWREMRVKIESAGEIEIVGKKYTQSQLELIGEFYRFAKDENYSLTCIDERVMPKKGEVGVHCKCGMCAAVGKAIDESNPLNVEDVLAQEMGLDEADKQQLCEGTQDNHYAVSICLSFADHHLTLDNRNITPEQAKSGVLPFNITLPSSLIDAFLKAQDLNKDQKSEFLQSLIDWNAHTARAIIGHHNHLSQFADKTQLILSGYEPPLGQDLAKLAIGAVEPKQTHRISSQSEQRAAAD